MPVSTGYDFGIRKALVGKGISNNDIGYNKGTGYVTIGGQDAIKAPKLYNGTAFTSEQDFNNEFTNYQKSLNPTTLVSGAGTGTGTGAGTGLGAGTGAGTGVSTGYNPYGTNNPFDTQISDRFKLLDALMNQGPVDVNQIYASPEFAARRAASQRGAQEGIRAAQESLGSAGFGRSTTLAERSQGIQNDANAFLETQVIPALIAQEEAQRQQKLQNQMAMINSLAGQQGVFDTRFNTAQDLSNRRAELTGNLLTPEAEATIQQIINLGESWKTASPDQRVQLNQEANRLRGLLPAMGVDPSLFGANVSTEQRRANLGRAGTPTLQGQSLDMAQAQQEWENAFRQGQFDYQMASDAWERAFKEKSFDQSVKDAAEARGLQWANLNQQQQQFIANQAFRDKQFEYEIARNKFAQGMETFKASGKMPDFMSDYGIDVSGMNNPAITDDLNAIYDKIADGEDPTTIIKQIDDKVTLGLEEKSNGDKLKGALYKLYPELDPNAPKKSSGLKTIFSPGLFKKEAWNPFKDDSWVAFK